MTRTEKRRIREIVDKYFCDSCLVYGAYEAKDELLSLIEEPVLCQQGREALGVKD